MSESSSPDSRLLREMIPNPAMWRLSMQISDDALDVVVHSLVEDNSLIYRHIPLDKAAASSLAALEDAIYENPLLLCDFAKTDCLIATQRFSLIPAEITDEDLKESIIAQFWNDADYTVLTDSLPGSQMQLIFAIPTALASFIRRTLPDARIHHAITPAIRYFSNSSRLGNSGKMYVSLRADAMDIIAFSSRGLCMANTLPFAYNEDALYYILAAIESTGIPTSEIELMLCGDRTVREALTPELRKFVSYVMPVIFPSAMFKAGKEAMLAPFNLILLPLCE